MAELKDLTFGALVRGILPDRYVKIVAIKWYGESAVDLTDKMSDTGSVGTSLFYRDDEPRLEVLEYGPQWSFDGDGRLLCLVSKAKNTSVSGMVETGILESGIGKIRLLRPRELPENWDPEKDSRFTIWEAAHHLIRVLDQSKTVAVELMATLGPDAKAARELTYRLYHTCEQKNAPKKPKTIMH